MRTNKPIITFLILVQIIFCIYLFNNIYNKKNKKQIQISPVSSGETNTKNSNSNEDDQFYFGIGAGTTFVTTVPWTKENIITKVNNAGLVDSQEYTIEKPKKTFRIITLGDSFTSGYYNKLQNNWTEILEKKLNEKKICKNIDNFEIINLALSGNDIMLQSNRYGIEGQKYNPDLIIWTLVDKSRFCKIENIGINKCEEKFKDSTSGDNWYQCIAKIREELVLSKYSDNQIENMQRNYINKIYNFYKNKILFIDYFGNHKNITSNLPNSTTIDNLLERFLLKEKKKEEISYPDSHPNKLGHQLIATIIYEQLFKTNQISCESLE